MDWTPRTTPRPSATFDASSLSEIRRAAATGIYDIRGAGAKRKVPHFDDLLFLGASISAFWSMSITVAARLAGPDRIGRAMMFTSAGVSLATVAGVPLRTAFAHRWLIAPTSMPSSAEPPRCAAPATRRPPG